MPDTKITLKEAREAIKNKNYELSLKLCKQILREDNTNYMALVLLGVSLQETARHDEALVTFKNAVKVNPSNALAWNGIINYYEKFNREETKNDLINAYISLLNTESTERKLIEGSQKLCNLSEYGNQREIVSAIYSLLKNGKCTQVADVAVSLVNILSKDKNLAPDLMLMYEESLEIVLSNQSTVCINYYAAYLNLLYKLSKIEDVIKHAKKMHVIFQSDSTSLKWLCKIFNECYVESEMMIENEENIVNYSESLLRFEPQSATALFTKGILLVQHKNFAEAKAMLDQVVNLLPGMLHAWILLLKCCVRMYLYTEAVQMTYRIDKILQSNKDSMQKLKNVVDGLVIDVLSRSDEEADLMRALELYETVDCEIKPSCLCHVIRANINLNNVTQAKSLLQYFEKDSNNTVMFKLLSAQLLHKQGYYKEALDFLNDDNADLPEWWLQIGELHWSSGQYEKSLMPFLKAAKLDPANYKCFLVLGHYYKKFNDLDKARRCYEKSFKLNTKSSEAGIELSKIYRKVKNWDANLNLLQALTDGVINKKNCWAWIQLGLHYLEQQDYDKAIANLRFVIRIDETNIYCWESLADAYLANGAFTSALKCYEKVISLSEDSLYPLLQMATIKKIIGEFTEAIFDFEQILKSNDKYVPALKGVAETYLLQAKECFKNQRLGTGRDYAECAANYLIRALQQRKDLACLWKLLGDSCFLATDLPEQYSYLVVPFSLVDNEAERSTSYNKNDLFTLASKCYHRSLCFVEDNVLLWHDLATCYLSHARNTNDPNLVEQLINNAQAIAQFCVSKNPSYWQHWNLLGNIAMYSEPPNFKLAQHSFIKAVIADENNATSWCNLGTLYFMLKEYKLANDAYSQAQRANPNYINSWIGQALLAEALGHEDAMDLFRHSVQLGFHKQGALGYAHWVCKTLKDSPVDAVLYSIHNMHAIPVACDVMTWYTAHNQLDSTAWNMLGLLKERMGLKLAAAEAFKHSVDMSDEQHRDLAKINFGRLLAATNKYTEAIKIFTEVETATFNSCVGLALALFKNKRYKESYESYESTLHWLSEEPVYQSDLLVALASMAYMFEDSEAAKTLLFQSVQLEQPSPWGFYATLAVGLLHKDIQMAELVLNELETLKNRIDCVEHVAVLSSYFYLLQNDYERPIRETSRIIHVHPDQAAVWLRLSMLLIRLQKNRFSSNAAEKCALIAMKLGQNNVDVTKVLCLVAVSFLAIGDTQNALLMAQKAVHFYPNLPESWAVLIGVLSTTKRVTGTYLKNVSALCEFLGCRGDLHKWLKNII